MSPRAGATRPQTQARTARASGAFSLADVFIHLHDEMERFRAGAEGAIGIEDYTVMQPTLEQVFLLFARRQEETDDRRPL